MTWSPNISFAILFLAEVDLQCHKDTEIKFVDCYWPEFSVWRFIAVLLDYQVGLLRKGHAKED